MITTSRPTIHLCPRTLDELPDNASRGMFTGPIAGSESQSVKFKVCISCCANLILSILGYTGILSIFIRKGGVG